MLSTFGFGQTPIDEAFRDNNTGITHFLRDDLGIGMCPTKPSARLWTT